EGRRADDLKFVVQAGVVVGRTEEEAADKWRTYREHASLDGILAHSSLPVDLTAYPRDWTVADAVDRAGIDPASVPFLPFGKTVGEALDGLRTGREGRYFVAGTPKVVADEIERWLDEDGVDGINLRQYHSFGTARDFAELVVPELRRRGRLIDADAAPTTLRQRLFGRGDRLPETHIAARYRGGAHLGEPVPALFGEKESAA
ncbi:MAG: LLM class flavin-dependent oxidoreductase, partial [Actinomycetota bacterium]|nr:LLM class flavin-dependent oxidoreductase [Actinomycetota bacterium]